MFSFALIVVFIHKIFFMVTPVGAPSTLTSDIKGVAERRGPQTEEVL